MDDFVHGLSSDWPHEECPKVFAIGLGDNPRQIKRTVNTFLMLWKLAEKRKDKLKERIKPVRLAKVVAIQTIYPNLYNLLLKGEPRYLRELEEYFRFEALEARNFIYKEDGEKELVRIQKEISPALSSFISGKGIGAVRRILTIHDGGTKDANFADLSPEELRLYFTLTARAETPGVTPSIEERLIFEPQMVKIPAGKFSMGTTKEQAQEILKYNNSSNWQEMLEWEQPQHTVDLNEYFIGKYPITNREYQAFIKDAKYKTPQDWDGDQFPGEKGGHPAVFVSWEDANAYCKWLSEKTGKNYRLPTEAEWEKAARGEEGRIYPWGNEFDSQKVNSSEHGINNTSEVGQFSPVGDSPYGCADMAGNVWEWCSDIFDEQEYKKRRDGELKSQTTEIGKFRVLRGGSWANDRWPIRCARRNKGIPNMIKSSTGFRVAHL